MADESPAPDEAVNEYERERVPDKALKGPSSFWGMYAGEHTAGTEFMLGPLFVAWGASATDLVFGLLLGNLLAVLTWRFLTAEIATSVRLTLYYQLEKICGRGLVTIYNFANGVLFCFLAGAMVTVSATAVGVPFGDSIQMPSFTDTMPTGIVWILTCVAIGIAMTFVAVRGYAFVARISHIAAPWMFLIFVACGVLMLGRLGTANLWEVIKAPSDPNASRIGFWGIVCFGWFCNAAMHLGMSDMSIFRYARKPSYGWATSAGMYLGHYVAWICAALLLVYWVNAKGANATQGVPPGPMVWDAVGWAGLICVVVAGWTTANPTIYRAGLAFQGMFPKMTRTTGTIIAGTVCTVASVFPAFAMKLLDFVGIYGTILAPVGAVIFVNHFMPKAIGIQDYAAKTRTHFNIAVLLAWIIPVAIGLWFYKTKGVSSFFLPLPCWIACGILYIVFAKMLNRTAAQPNLATR